MTAVMMRRRGERKTRRPHVEQLQVYTQIRLNGVLGSQEEYLIVQAWWAG